MSARFKNLTPMLQTSDMKRTVEWYTAVLSFRRVGAVDENWCRLERDGVAIMFMRNSHLETPHATATQYFYVDDVMSLWNDIKDRVATEWGPRRMPYGMLEFAIRDPDGYYLSFGEPVGEMAPH